MNELDSIKAMLRDDMYPDSKDWSEGSTLDRVVWLLTMYKSRCEDVTRLQVDVHELATALGL